MFKFNKLSGQASRLLLVLAVVVFVAVIITFLVMKMAEKPPTPNRPDPTPIELPVFEQIIGDIRFVYQSSIDRGNTLKASDITDKKYASYQKDLYIGNSGAKFIQVTIGAQNIGNQNTGTNVWDIENVIDSEGRNFTPVGYNINPWLPENNLCGSLLKPAFDPNPCTKIYEVSKESKGFKIRVIVKKNDGKSDSALIDLIVK